MTGHFATFSIVIWCILAGILVEALTSEEREAVVKIHNDLRSQLAQGKSVDGQGRSFPQAANMAKLYYDENLERSAQASANKCIFKHTPQAQPPKFGENIAFKTKDMSKKDHLIAAAKSWWGESTECNNLDIRKPLPNSPSCYLHFTAMAWAKTTRIGCGFKECPDSQYGSRKYVFCQYQIPGNMLRDNVYDIGTTCSKCAENKSCDTKSGLCYENNMGNPNKRPTNTNNPQKRTNRRGSGNQQNKVGPTNKYPTYQPVPNWRQPQRRPKFSQNGKKTWNNYPQYSNNWREQQRRPSYSVQQQMSKWN